MGALVQYTFGEDELSNLMGTSVYFRLVDDRAVGWGFVALDNLAYPILLGGPPAGEVVAGSITDEKSSVETPVETIESESLAATSATIAAADIEATMMSNESSESG